MKWFNDYSLITCLAFKFPGLHVLRSHCQLCTCTVMAMHIVLFDSSSAASHSLYIIGTTSYTCDPKVND